MIEKLKKEIILNSAANSQLQNEIFDRKTAGFQGKILILFEKQSQSTDYY